MWVAFICGVVVGGAIAVVAMVFINEVLVEVEEENVL
jgi:hypothetical protein